MTDSHAQRRLIVILAADVVGYGRLMELDDVKTLDRLKRRRKSILEPLVAKHRGRIFKFTGDGVLVEFPSAVGAVQCAIELQLAMASANGDSDGDRQIVLRIGIDLGDIIVEGSDLYGDGVNIASRLEAIAEPGGILVSAAAFDQVRNKVNARFDDMGLTALKNVSHPIQVFRIADLPIAAPETAQAMDHTPSIAVLPFDNLSGDPEQNYFADGVVEDIITTLSRVGSLLVIARNSSFKYRGRALDVRAIGRDLGARYILEGSVRKAMNRVRVTGQLIDTANGAHVWAERFDADLEDVFALQDEVAGKIVEALIGRLMAPRARAKPKSMEAYDLCVRARSLSDNSPQDAAEALLLLQRALLLDPDYAEAHAMLAHNCWLGWSHWGRAEEPQRSQSLASARKAVALDPNDAGARWILGNILAYERRWQESETEFKRALDLDPNHADTWAIMSDLEVLGGRIDEGTSMIQRALRLNPHPPPWYFLILGQAQYGAGQYAAAVATLRRKETYQTSSRRFLAASLAQLGRLDEARQEAELFLVSNPHFTIGFWVSSQPFQSHETRDHFVEGLRKAGFPD